jgi:hypothetical protein
MFRHSYVAVMIGLGLCGGYTLPASAQQNDARDVVYEAARNKIGLFRYCRRKGLLDAAAANQAIRTVETGLKDFTNVSNLAETQGDRAEQAGEDGLLEANSNRAFADVATLFRTTPSGLCREWAEETLRLQRPEDFTQIIQKTASPPPSEYLPPRPAPASAPIKLVRQPATPVVELPRQLPTSAELTTQSIRPAIVPTPPSPECP